MDSLVKSIKKFRDSVGHPTLSEDFIIDASKKSITSRCTKEVIAEMMYVSLKQ